MQRKWIDVGGPVHYAELDGPGDGPTFVLVHGLGGSHVNWSSVAPGLARLGRVLVPDLAGFGRTPLAGRSASVPANRALLDGFLAATEAAPALLIGNSMGGAISALQAATHPESVAGLVLVNPALPRARGQLPDPQVAAIFATYMIPGVGERFVRERAKRLGPERLVRETLAVCTVDAARVDPGVVADLVELARERAEMPWATKAYLEAARSLVRLLARRERFLATLGSLRCPTLLLAGRYDRLVNLAAAEHCARLHPDWDFRVLDDLGHVPQLEDPTAFLAGIIEWLGERLSGAYPRLATLKSSS